MKTNRLNLAALHNEEWLGFFSDFKLLVLFFGVVGLGIGTLFDQLVPLFEQADKLMVVLRKSVLTLALEQADKKRDDFFRGLSDIVKGSLQQPDANKQKAALRLDNLLNAYRKSILSGNYAEESLAIYNLLQDLKGAYAADVALLALGEWVTAITQADREFQAIRGERTQESIAKPRGDLRKIRRQIDVIYHAIIAVLDAKLLADGLGGAIDIDPDSLKDGIYESDVPDHLRGNVVYNFVIAWNETVKKYHNLLAQREGRREAANSEE